MDRKVHSVQKLQKSLIFQISKNTKKIGKKITKIGQDNFGVNIQMRLTSDNVSKVNPKIGKVSKGIASSAAL